MYNVQCAMIWAAAVLELSSVGRCLMSSQWGTTDHHHHVLIILLIIVHHVHHILHHVHHDHHHHHVLIILLIIVSHPQNAASDPSMIQFLGAVEPGVALVRYGAPLGAKKTPQGPQYQQNGGIL